MALSVDELVHGLKFKFNVKFKLDYDFEINWLLYKKNA